MLLPIAQALVLQGMALVVGAAAGRAAVPAFAAARTLSRVGMQLCWVVSTPLMPEFSSASARGDRLRMATILLATLMVSCLLVMPYALGFMALGGRAMALWTHGTIAAPAGLVAAMGATILFGGIWYPVSNLLLACNRHARYTTWYVVLALASLPSGYLLTRLMGVTGAALTMALLDLAMLAVVAVAGRAVLASATELRMALLNVASLRRLRRSEAT
jgi:O-antigen/teichoic acid export membrane protein